MLSKLKLSLNKNDDTRLIKKKTRFECIAEWSLNHQRIFIGGLPVIAALFIASIMALQLTNFDKISAGGIALLTIFSFFTASLILALALSVNALKNIRIPKITQKEILLLDLFMNLANDIKEFGETLEDLENKTKNPDSQKLTELAESENNPFIKVLINSNIESLNSNSKLCTFAKNLKKATKAAKWITNGSRNFVSNMQINKIKFKYEPHLDEIINITNNVISIFKELKNPQNSESIYQQLINITVEFNLMINWAKKFHQDLNGTLEKKSNELNDFIFREVPFLSQNGQSLDVLRNIIQNIEECAYPDNDELKKGINFITCRIDQLLYELSNFFIKSIDKKSHFEHKIDFTDLIKKSNEAMLALSRISGAKAEEKKTLLDEAFNTVCLLANHTKIEFDKAMQCLESKDNSNDTEKEFSRQVKNSLKSLEKDIENFKKLQKDVNNPIISLKNDSPASILKNPVTTAIHKSKKTPITLLHLFNELKTIYFRL